MTPDRLKQVARLLGFAAGVVLIAWAVWLGLANADLDRLVAASRVPLVWMAVAVALTLAVTGVLFWVVTLNFDADPRVGLGRMTQLISASSLLNYLPFRPGLLGRAVYLKRMHRLPLRQSMVVWLIVMGVSAMVYAVAVAAFTLSPPDRSSAGVSAAVLALLVLTPAAGPAAARLLGRPMCRGWSWIPLRTIETLIAGARLWLALKAVGAEVGFTQAVAAAAAGNLIAVLPIVPNGLGLREWIAAGLLAANGLVPLEAAALAAVIDRGIEVIVVVPVGLLAVQALRRQDAGERTQQ